LKQDPKIPRWRGEVENLSVIAMKNYRFVVEMVGIHQERRIQLNEWCLEEGMFDLMKIGRSIVFGWKQNLRGDSHEL
jgi:hypothetical protein